ncbi:MAG: glycoside hydrolase/phage tail family protein [Litoreibacter sp.]
MIPGTGEYALATSPIYRDAGAGQVASNINSAEGVPDIVSSLEALSSELPECGSVSLIVSWFGDDLRVGHCGVAPKVEFDYQAVSNPSYETRSGGAADGWHEGLGEEFPWVVSGLQRGTADTIAQIDGRPVYGGTPSDGSVVEGIEALHAAGKSINFYPFLLMEILEGSGKPDPWQTTGSQQPLPWRGRITTDKAPGVSGSTDGTFAARGEVDNFMGTCQPEHFHITGKTVSYSGPAEKSYRRFILHYAALCKAAGGVSSFCIGSEMRGLTQIRDETGGFPAVRALVQLAADVREILGSSTKIGYAADWSEYFGYQPADAPGDVIFHLDPLWADSNIDFIGIDNYMPLSDWRDDPDHLDQDAKTIYDLDYLRNNIEGGEGFDWYYASEADRETQTRTLIEDLAYNEPWVYRYKDLRSWWSNNHHNRVGGERASLATAWVPQSKPIWFTELGCAAVDKGTNQPNKFVDPKSSESSLPYFSTGRRDDYIQMQYIRAYYSYFALAENNPTSGLYGDRMIDMSRAYVWAWDGRPWPDFPNNTSLWSDGPNHAYGHWLNGRTGSQPLSEVVATICEASGLYSYDVSNLHGVVRGYVMSDVQTARAALQPLMVTYGFDAVERGGVVVFRNRQWADETELDRDMYVVVDGDDAVIEHVRAPEAEVVGQVRIGYVEAEGEFTARVAEARLPDDNTPVSSQNDVPLALNPAEAQSITERWLSESRVSRDTVRLTIPPSCCDVGAGDILRLPDTGGTESFWRIDRVEAREGRAIEAVRMERELYTPSRGVEELSQARSFVVPVPMDVQFLDLPLLVGNEDPYAPYVATSASPWPGAAAVYGATEDSDYVLNSVLERNATQGATLNELSYAPNGLWDRGEGLDVKIGSGALSSVPQSAVLNGANVCAIGDGSIGNWEILQFSQAELIAPYTYRLSIRLRGQAGTDGVVPNIWPSGSRFILLDDAPTQISFDPSRRGLERHYRVGPAAKPFTDAVYRHLKLTVESVGLRPYAPTHLRVLDMNGDLHVNWVRRTRIDGDSWAAFEVPIGEDSEQYLLQVMHDDVVVREEMTSLPNWTYSSEQRAVDGSVSAIRVAQLSQSFGPGPFKRIEINV